MPTNITGFQMMRRKQKEKLDLKEIKIMKEAKDEIEPTVNTDKVDVEAMTIEEVRAKLTELDVYFQPNTGEAKLKAKLEGVLNGTD